jgi:hypothetical protein
MRRCRWFFVFLLTLANSSIAQEKTLLDAFRPAIEGAASGAQNNMQHDALRAEIERAARDASVTLSDHQITSLLSMAGRQPTVKIITKSETSPQDKISPLASYLDAKARYAGTRDLAGAKIKLDDFDWQYLSPHWRGVAFVPVKNEGLETVFLQKIEAGSKSIVFTQAVLIGPGDAFVAPVFETTRGGAFTAFYAPAFIQPAAAAGSPVAVGAVAISGRADVFSWSPRIFGERGRVAIGVAAKPPGAVWYLNSRPHPIPDSEKAVVPPGTYSVRVVREGHEDYCESKSNVTVDWIVNAALAQIGAKSRSGRCGP